MTVTVTSIIEGPLTANGVTTTFGFPFKVMSAAELSVYQGAIGDWALVNDALYSVTLNSGEGGQVVFTAAPTGSPLYIVSNPSFQQQGGFVGGEVPFTPVAVGSLLDQAAIRALVLKNGVDRSLKVPIGETPPVIASLDGADGMLIGVVEGELRPVGNTAAVSAEEAAGSAEAAAASVLVAAGHEAGAATHEVGAGVFAAAAAGSATAAGLAKSAAEGILAFTGLAGTYDTKALANAAVGSIPDGSVVMVLVDETYGGRRVIYRKAGGVLSFRVIPDKPVVWYVRHGGSDAAAGVTHSTAFATLARVQAVVRPGDTIRVQVSRTKYREALDLSAIENVNIERYGAGARYATISGWDVVTAFTLDSGALYSFTITLAAGAAQRAYPGVFENGNRLYEVFPADGADDPARKALVASLASANGGAFYFAGPGTQSAGWAAGVKTYFMQTSDGTNPATNGRTYEVYAREFPFKPSFASRIEGIRIDSGFHHNGLGDGNWQMIDCPVVQPARHGSLPSTGTYVDHTVIGQNWRYDGGGATHSNPSTLAPWGTHIRTCVVGEPARPSGIAFYTHGAANGVVVREGVTLVDCHAYHVNQVLRFEETGQVDAIRLKAQHFGELIATGVYGSPLVNMVNCDCRGGSAAGGTPRFLSTLTGKRLNIRGGYYEAYIANFFSQASGSHAGTVDIEDAVCVLNGQDLAGGSQSFFRTEQPTTRDFDAITLRRSTFMVLPNSGLNYFINTRAIVGALTVDDILVCALDATNGYVVRDPIVRLNGVDTPLSTISGARYHCVDPERVIEGFSDKHGEGVIFRPGTYRPGMKSFSGVVRTPGSDQPRRAIAVGDIIVSFNANNVFARLENSPTTRLRGVAFDNNTDTFTAVGDGGVIWRSGVNGTNWAAVSSPTSANLLAITFHASSGTGVAVGAGGVIVKTSDGGATWALATESGTATTRTLRAVATDGTTWVAAGDEGRVVTSTDRDDWTEATVGSVSHYALLWAGGIALFLLGSEDGGLRTSPASISWTTRTSGTTNRISCFAQGEGGIVAGIVQTKGSGPVILHSTDAVTWTDTGFSCPFDIRSLAGTGNAAAFSDNRAFLAVGDSEWIGASRFGKRWEIAPALPRDLSPGKWASPTIEETLMESAA